MPMSQWFYTAPCPHPPPKCISCWHYMPNTGCQESLLIQITQEPRLRDFMSLCACRVAITTERECDEINTGFQNYHGGVRHSTSAYISLANQVPWPHLTSKGQGNSLLPFTWKKNIWKYLINSITLTQGTHTCPHTCMCIVSKFKKKWVRFHILWNLLTPPSLYICRYLYNIYRYIEIYFILNSIYINI